jgi:uncharacterized protein (DUF305 family)
MKFSKKYLLVYTLTLLLVATLLSGCMPAMPGMNQGQMPMGNATHTPMAEMNRGMNHGMDHGMKMDPNKPLDAQFIDGMLVHHQGAIEMAKEVLLKAEHAELKEFANAIITAQSKEIGDMQGWRKTWYTDLPDTGGMSMSMGEMSIDEDASKPFDQRFLTAMISHHQGAIDMAKMVLQMGAEHNEVKTLSEAIIQAQQAEIEQMQAWLKAWYNQ